MNILKKINSKILYKLILGFVFISLFAGVVSYIGFGTISEIKSSYLMISTKSIPLIEHLKDMKFACLRLISSASELAYIQSENKNQSEPESLEHENELIKQSCNSCHAAYNKYKHLAKESFPETFEHINEIRINGDSLHIVAIEFIEMKRHGLSGADVLEKKEQMESYEMKFLEAVNGTILHTNAILEEEKSQLFSTISSSLNNILFLSILSFIISLLIGIIYSRSLSKPITKLTHQVNEFRKGNLEASIDLISSNEIGVLGNSFQEMAAKIKLLISQLEDEIHESKQIQNALTESERLLRSFREKVPIGIYRTTPDGRILYANPSMVKILGFETIDDLTKINLEEQIFENQQKRKIFKENIEILGEITQYEDTYIKFDGSIIFINEYSTCVRDDDGNVKYYEGIVEDVTERKKANESLKQSQQLLKDLNDSKDRFFSIIAHDLKNPLSTFIMSTKMLSSNWEMFNEDEKILLLNQMYINSKNLLQLLDNLLTWSRSQSRSLEFIRTNFDLSVPANKCIGLLNASALQKGIELSSEISENTVIFADYNMITTVIRNLISNSIKYTNKGGDVTVSSVNSVEDEKYLVVSVKDSGVGMDKEDVEKLFRLDFRQSSPGTSDERGTGLGLLICKDFVEKNKGKIWVESEKGKGSTFSFTVLKHDI